MDTKCGYNARTVPKQQLTMTTSYRRDWTDSEQNSPSVCFDRVYWDLSKTLYCWGVVFTFIKLMNNCLNVCSVLCTVTLYYYALFTFSHDTYFPASQQSTGRCVFLHRAMLQMSRWLYRTHCRGTLRALALVSKSGSLMTCVRQTMTDFMCQTLPSLLGKEHELPFKQNGD